MGLGKKKIKELKKQIKESKKALKELEAKKTKKLEKAQHKVIEDLETMMEDEIVKKESLLELGEEAWQEAKALLSKLKGFVKK